MRDLRLGADLRGRLSHMTMTYPTVEQVNDSGINAVLRWNRFLPSPRNDGEVAVINAVVKRLAKLKAEDPAAAVTASKEVGWE